jgi:hypothetical protein
MRPNEYVKGSLERTIIHWTTLLNDCYRPMPAFENDPVNDRKGDLTRPWLETFD